MKLVRKNFKKSCDISTCPEILKPRLEFLLSIFYDRIFNDSSFLLVLSLINYCTARQREMELISYKTFEDLNEC